MTERYADRPPVDTAAVEDALSFAVDRVDSNLERYTDCFPPGESEDLVYGAGGPSGWTAGFWTGMTWLCYERTGAERYREVAATHARRSADHLVRDDGSTFHTYRFDTETGEPLRGETRQGYADDSCWTRGQAWAIYGFALVYGYTGDTAFRAVAREVADYYLKRVPEDHVPPWDFDAPAEDAIRDSSAAAIAACGLLELADAVPASDPDRQRYENAALATLGSLAENYTTEGMDSNGILHSATGNKNKRGGEECCLWGDYFYTEGLVRASADWEPYW